MPDELLDKNVTFVQGKNMLVSFEGFLHYLAATDIHFLDECFLPIAHHCSPCEFDFHFLARTEDLAKELIPAFETVSDKNASDLQMIDKIKGSTNTLPVFKSLNEKYKQKQQDSFLGKSSKIQKIYSAIANKNMTLLLKVYQKYQYDFILFGYTLDGYFDSYKENELIDEDLVEYHWTEDFPGRPHLQEKKQGIIH